MTFFTKNEEETIKLAEKIGLLLKKGDILAMKGDLASGKTTFTKGIAKALKIEDNITSPTFCLINEYEGEKENEKIKLYHFDVYRLSGEEEFLNLGSEEILYGEGICVIEWSEKVEGLLPKKSIVCEIKTIKDCEREIKIENWNNGKIDWEEKKEF